MQTKDFYQKAYQFSLVLLILGSCYFFGRTLYTQYEIIISPYQMDYRETVLASSVELMSQGGNPYRIENQPEYAQAYGIVQDLIHYPFVKIFGSSLGIHRFVTVLGCLLCCLILIFWLIELKVSKIISICSSLVFYFSILFWQLGIYRPDSWALFFMLLSMYLPFKYNYSIKSLSLSVFFGLLAFYTKSYFVLGSVVISSFMFFFISKKKGIGYGFSFLFLFILTIYIVSYFFPLFFYLTVLSFLNYSTGGDWSHANFQFIQFVRINVAILFLLLIFIIRHFYNRNKKVKTNEAKIRWNLSSFNAPLFIVENTRIEITFRLYTFLFMLFMIHYFFGRNNGAYLSYYFTHITPFLVLLTIPLTRNTSKLMNSIACILILFGIWNARKALFPHKMNKEQIEQWEKAKKYIQNSSNTLGTPAIANLIKERGLKVYEQGLLVQFIFIGNVEKPFLQNLFPRYKEIQEVIKNFDKDIAKKIQNKEFDLIAMPDIHKTIASDKNVELYYDPVDSVRLEMPYTGQSWKTVFWKPKK